MNILHKPLFIIPGFGGSKLVLPRKKPKLYISLDKIFPETPKNDFVNLNVFDKEWEQKFQLKYNKNSGLVLNDSIDVHDFGGVEGIRNLCDDCDRIDGVFNQIFKTKLISDVYNYKYFDTFIKTLCENNFKIGVDLYGLPYDFRKIMIPDYLQNYFSRTKTLIEDAHDVTGKSAIIVAHSIGCLITYLFLVEYCNPSWKNKYIDTFVSINGPYGGSSIALKTILSGLPNLNILKDRYGGILQNSTGILLALPNINGYNKSDTIIYDMKNRCSYNVDEYEQVLPDSSREILNMYVKPHHKTLTLNTEVNTIIVAGIDTETQFSYKYDGFDFLKEPIETINTTGDNVVHLKSLKIHQANTQNFPNYKFIDIDKGEHTKILHSRDLMELVMSIQS